MIQLALLSALLLSFYDVFKKISVRHNAVMPVLFRATLSGWLALTAGFALTGHIGIIFTFPSAHHIWVLLKAFLVGGSWVFMYYAMRSLPVSIVAPLRASAPFWTLLGAILLYGEIPSFEKGFGMVLILTGYVCFTVSGKAENIRFGKHPGIRLAFIGTLMGAASGLYDKFLLQTLHLERIPMQFWFSFYLIAVTGGWLMLQRAGKLNRTPFTWRWSIPLVGILLIGADWVYFKALSEPNAPVSVISLIRRSGIVLTFLTGILFFKEKATPWKVAGLITLLFGVILICL